MKREVPIGGCRLLGYGLGEAVQGESMVAAIDKDGACLIPVNPCSRRIGAEILHPMCSRLGNLDEDSRNKFQYVAGLAFRMGEHRVVVEAYAPWNSVLETGVQSMRERLTGHRKRWERSGELMRKAVLTKTKEMVFMILPS